jgi:hypothetical protein
MVDELSVVPSMHIISTSVQSMAINYKQMMWSSLGAMGDVNRTTVFYDLYGVERLSKQSGTVHGEKERSSLDEVWAHVGFRRIQKRIANQDEVGLEMLNLQPCIAEEYLFQPVDLVVRDVDREFGPIEDIPEWVMGLITE